MKRNDQQASSRGWQCWLGHGERGGGGRGVRACRGANWWLSVGVVLLVVLLADAAMACPTCKDSIASNGAESAQGLSAGINYSIFILLGAITGALGLVVGKCVQSARRAGG